MTTPDVLVDAYLRRLDDAAAVLPPDRRGELVDSIREHIAGAQAAGAVDEAATRTLLDRLGDPDEIVAAAQEESRAGGWAPALVPRPRGTGLELAAVLMLTVGSFLPVVGWVTGVVLLWLSSLWRVREKLLGTLVVPFGPGVVLYGAALLPFGRAEVCTSTPDEVVVGARPGAPPQPAPPPPDVVSESITCTGTSTLGVLSIPLALVLLVAPIVVAVVLMRLARRRAAAEAPVLVPASAGAASPWGPLEVAAVLLLGLGGFLLPVVGPLVGLVLAAVSPRWTVRDKVIAGALALSPALVALSSLGLPAPSAGWLVPGGWELFLILLVACPAAAAYLGLVLPRRAAARG